MATFQNLKLNVSFSTLDPIVDSPSFDLSYFTTFVTADIYDVNDLCNTVMLSLHTIPSGGSVSPAGYMHTVIDRGAGKTMITVYDVTTHLNGSPAGSPVLRVTGALTSAAVGGLVPAGCCAVVTMQAPYGSDVEFAPGARPRARDRGRIYFGPIGNSAIADDSSSKRTYFTSTFRNDMCQWIKSINTFTTTTHSAVYNLGVWSRKNAAMKSLQEVWVDERVDYQRRREDQGVFRTVVGLP